MKTKKRRLVDIREDIREVFENAPRDEEGEIIFDKDWYDALKFEEQDKIEGAALRYKECCYLRDACKEEAKKLKDRADAYDRDANGYAEFLEYAVDGQEFETPKVLIKHRPSKRLIVDEEASIPEKWIIEKTTTRFDIAGMKDAILKEGAEIPGVHVEDCSNMIVR